ncbi:MAG: galactokinase [Planctomycetota bacterium]|jgi:galactokinase|nr:galactokinase [Planctomycetota bacterium]
MDALITRAVSEFSDIFGEKPSHFGDAPGRVEVIGNHTDYNHGFILASAIDRRLAVVGRPVDGETARVYSRTFNSGASFRAADPVKMKENPWVNYIMGVIWQLRNKGVKVGAFDAMILGDVPLGAGLSSSAALEVATAFFLRAMNGFSMDPIAIAVNCQAAENNFVGMNCGILDQFASAMAQPERLVFLDCRNLDAYSYYPLGSAVKLVIANTKAPHVLVDGAYNRLREACFRAARICAEKFPEKRVTHLRDVDPELLDACKNAMGEEDYRRAHHIVTENARVLAGAEALTRGDYKGMGGLMTASHASSRDWFGNSATELDAMVDLALEIPGCYGARLSGGGFGGATINLVESDKAEDFAQTLADRYREKIRIEPEIHLFKAGAGAGGGAL